jgi:hypothetical protein
LQQEQQEPAGMLLAAGCCCRALSLPAHLYFPAQQQ